jgi:hypothetical protein
MIEGLENLLEGSSQPGLTELRTALQELIGGPEVRGRLIEQHPLKPRVYRLRLEFDDHIRSLVIKRHDPDIAWRNRLVAERWMPAIGLGQSGPALLGAAAERGGCCVWHLYEDLGDWALDNQHPDPEQVMVAVELVAQIHGRFAGHALLGECRLWGGDLGIHFYAANVRDAIYGLEALRSPAVTLSPEHAALRNRLLDRMHCLLDEQTHRAQSLAECGGPETLVHGDLWTTNTLVIPTQHGFQARLIDWDRAGVGPVSYDLSTFLLRFPIHHRLWILNAYREFMEYDGWRLPSTPDLNLLFDTAECARFANRAIWPAMALLTDGADWGFDELAEVEQWFETLEPVLPLNNVTA